MMVIWILALSIALSSVKFVNRNKFYKFDRQSFKYLQKYITQIISKDQNNNIEV